MKLMEAPATPLNLPVPAPMKVLNGATGGLGPLMAGSKMQTPSVRFSKWKLFSSLAPGQLTSRVLGEIGGLPQWISKPCVTRIAPAGTDCPVTLVDVAAAPPRNTNTLPPPVIRPKRAGGGGVGVGVGVGVAVAVGVGVAV